MAAPGFAAEEEEEEEEEAAAAGVVVSGTGVSSDALKKAAKLVDSFDSAGANLGRDVKRENRLVAGDWI